MLTDFHVSGYKSLYDCTISDLEPINLFHGDNNVGKSNILEALQSFFYLLTHPEVTGVSGSTGEYEDWFSWGEQEIHLSGVFRLPEREYRAEVLVKKERADTIYFRVDAPDLPPISFYRIPARRRLEAERKTQTEQRLNPEGANLKERLFWASVSQDPEERKAFYNVLRPLFSEPPLALGTLQPVAAPGGPYDLQMETADRSIPLEQMGSGIQQLVLLSGLIALSRADVIAIEEPEMNLSWSTQKKLCLILQKMVDRQDVPPHQVFISSHSPLFEFYENFYRVDMEDGRTQITRVANVERRRIFDSVTPPLDGRAAWLHEDNVVILPPYVVETLGIRRGDLIYFLPEHERVVMMNERDFTAATRPPEDGA
jgi:predicted ATPase